MSTSTSGDPKPPSHSPMKPASLCQHGIARAAVGVRPVSITGSTEEDAFWARYEDREEGRHAIEADHLFDTSYAWAV